MKTKLITTIMTMLFLASATVMTMPVKGNPATLNVPSVAYPTIQAAATAASPGDTIIVAAGTYTENIVINKWLILKGAGSGSSPASNTVITSATANTPTITIGGGISTTDRMVIANIRVTGATGIGNQGSGIIVRDQGSGTSHITFDNVAAVANGWNGIAFDCFVVNDIIFNQCYLSNNVGDGIRFPASATTSGVTINGCTFDSDTADPVNQQPSGIIAFGSVDGLTVNDGKFTGNYWGIFFDVESSGQYVRNVLVTCAIFDNNYRGFQVGIYTQFSPPYHDISNIQVHDSIFTNSIEQGVRFYADGPGYENVVIDARNNWWGSTTGPTHSSNPSGTGDEVSDQVNFDPWLAGVPCVVPEVPIGAIAACASMFVAFAVYLMLKRKSIIAL